MISDEGQEGARSFIHVPTTLAELPPAQQADLGLLMRLFLREVYDTSAAALLAAQSGEAPSITMNIHGDEWEMAAQLQRIAQEMPAYTRLASELSRNAFRLKMRHAVKREVLGGVPYKQLQDQGRLKMIEDQRARREAEAAAKQAAE